MQDINKLNKCCKKCNPTGKTEGIILLCEEHRPSPTTDKGWEEEYWNKFNNRIGACFECCEAEDLLNDIKSFISKTITREVERERERIINIINSKRPINNEINNTPEFWINESADDIIEIIKNLSNPTNKNDNK